jgi:hypothetical protein
MQSKDQKSTGLVTVHGVGNLKEIACEGGRKWGAGDELENQPHPDEGTESACLQVVMVKVGAEDEGLSIHNRQHTEHQCLLELKSQLGAFP